MESERDFEIIRLQADIIQLQKEVKKLSKENAAISKILFETVKPVCDAFYHTVELQEDLISYG